MTITGARDSSAICAVRVAVTMMGGSAATTADEINNKLAAIGRSVKRDMSSSFLLCAHPRG
jgi:hypothetical protein